MITRLTLTPPAVEPAHPPINIATSRSILEDVGHVLKSAVANPVVVITDAALNILCLITSWTPVNVFLILNATSTVITAYIDR